MTTYNTGNPVGSTDVRDLYDNAQNLDSLVNGPLTSYADRLGAPRKSWRGIEQDFAAFLAASGFELPALEYVGGTPLVIDRPTQLIFRTGFPDTLYGVKSTESFPATLSGTWATDESRLVVRSDGDLRQDLANSTDPAKGAGLVGRGVVSIESVVDLINLPPDARRTDMAYVVKSYRGSDGGGIFVWDSAAQKSSHNGGTVIDPERPWPANWGVKSDVNAWFQPAASGLGAFVRVVDDASEVFSSWFGLGSDIPDCTFFFDGMVSVFDGKTLYISAGDYSIDKAFGPIALPTKIIGLGQVTLIKSVVGAGAYFTWPADCTVEGVTVRSTLPSVAQVRTVLKSRAVVRQCQVLDNQMGTDPLTADAWGFYLKDVSDAVLDSCAASGNTQSDFTIVDNVHNVRIVNGNAGSSPRPRGCVLNIEPNNAALGGVSGLSIVGGSYDIVSVIEPFILGEAINGVVFDGCAIGQLAYEGGKVAIRSCSVDSIYALSAGTVRMGQLGSDSILLGSNLISEPYLFDVSRDDVSSYWSIPASSITPGSRYARIQYESGAFIRLNPTKISGTVTLAPRSRIPVNAGSTYAVVAKTRKDQTLQVQAAVGLVKFYNASSALISTVTLWGNKIADSITPVQTEVGFVLAPAGAVTAQVELGIISNATLSLDVHYVGFYEVGFGEAIDSRIAELEAGKVPMLNHAPAATAGFWYPNYFAGERIENSAPAAGGYSGWVCTSSGTPGVWKGFGLIQS